MSRNRAERRREQREADRKCLTVADERRLDATRRLPNDFPTIARVLRNKKKQLSPKQLDELRSDVSASRSHGRKRSPSCQSCGTAASSGGARSNSPHIQGQSQGSLPTS